jgi:hypothetical protein
MGRAQNIAGLLAVTIMVAACDRLWPDAYWRQERYVLLAIDVKSQMSLSFDLEKGDAIGLVGPTVFALGFDQRYIVVKQHPALNQAATSFDRSITNYFVVDRIGSPNPVEREKAVRGPLKKEEFDSLATSLSLPPFTKSFSDLE